MSEIRAKNDEEFMKNAVKLSYASLKTVKQVSEDLGIGENLLYRWRKKRTFYGDKTRYATLEEEHRSGCKGRNLLFYPTGSDLFKNRPAEHDNAWIGR